MRWWPVNQEDVLIKLSTMKGIKLDLPVVT